MIRLVLGGAAVMASTYFLTVKASSPTITRQDFRTDEPIRRQRSFSGDLSSLSQSDQKLRARLPERSKRQDFARIDSIPKEALAESSAGSAAALETLLKSDEVRAAHTLGTLKKLSAADVTKLKDCYRNKQGNPGRIAGTFLLSSNERGFTASDYSVTTIEARGAETIARECFQPLTLVEYRADSPPGAEPFFVYEGRIPFSFSLPQSSPVPR